MKIAELYEAIKGWKHAHSDLMKLRAAKAASQHTAKLVSVKKDGTESGMHDAVSTYPTEAEARARHAELVKLNPGRNIRHNLYVNNQLVQQLDPNTIAEVHHKVGQAAAKALVGHQVTPEQQHALKVKFQQVQDKIRELQTRPDAHTGKYAKEFQNLERQKIKIARAGNLNAFGEPLTETATSGSTGAGSIAHLPVHQGAIIRRPNLFGYVPVTKKRTQKAPKNKQSHK